jgi:ABC-2 type transport system ATP-binding protein
MGLFERELSRTADGVTAGRGSGGQPTGAEPVIGARGISKRYGERLALSSVSFEACPGELVACIGPNGAGKTTLLNILAGIQKPDGGTVQRPSGRIGWVPQQPALYGKLTVAENLRLFARLEGAGDVEGIVRRMLAQAALEDRADEQLARLSGGNRQRVNVAIGLLADPTVLLLDEPSSALDSRQRERLWEFIGGLAERGTTVVYATHNVFEAEHYGDRVLVLADGERLFWGQPEELRAVVAMDNPSAAEGDFESAFVSFLRARGH